MSLFLKTDSGGPQGVTGAQGSQGFQGLQGATGAQGATGVQGATGAQGYQGNIGAQGNTGAQGSQGNQGNQGFQGAIGNQGYQGSQGPQGAQGGGSWGILTNTFPTAALECLSNTVFAPWRGAAIATGTISVNSTADHPGIIEITSSTSADSGYYLITAIAAFLIAGTEITEFIFQVPTTTNTVIRLGFQDSFAATLPTDAVEISIIGTTLDGRTYSNTTTSTTGTTYTITATVWYRGKIVVNSDATRVDFYLYNAAGTQLWTDYLTTNIPTGAGRNTGHGVLAINTGTTAYNICDLDFMNVYISRTLTR